MTLALLLHPPLLFWWNLEVGQNICTNAAQRYTTLSPLLQRSGSGAGCERPPRALPPLQLRWSGGTGGEENSAAGAGGRGGEKNSAAGAGGEDNARGRVPVLTPVQ